MNLELLDPFGRQIPDRVDATLELPAPLHFHCHPQQALLSPSTATTTTTRTSQPVGPLSLSSSEHDRISNKDGGTKESGSKAARQNSLVTISHLVAAAEEQRPEFKSAYHVAFNRRGMYLAAGYGSGTVAVFNLLSRTLSALYRGGASYDENSATREPEDVGSAARKAFADNPTKDADQSSSLGISCVSWSRRSRTMLAGAAGDKFVQLFDSTHPCGPDEACLVLMNKSSNADHDDDDGAPQHNAGHAKSYKEHTLRDDVPPNHSMELTKATSFRDPDERFIFLKDTRTLQEKIVKVGSEVPFQKVRRKPVPLSARGLRKYPSVRFAFPDSVGSSLQVHPRIPTAGMATLSNGALMLFWIHPSCWIGNQQQSTELDGTNEKKQESATESYDAPKVVLVPLWDKPTMYNITCAAFDPRGDRIYAATKDGSLLGFQVASIWKALTDSDKRPRTIPPVPPSFRILTTGGASTWHLMVSRNGKYMVLNCADGALRMYSTADCWKAPSKLEKPTWIFQDVVNKVKFASCDFSGDGEYVVGGANGNDDKYELYIWNTSTGALMDKLTGPSVQLYSVAWHPTRSFLAVATSDGLIDVWGPRINWTSFAPDFQALPMNVEYIEREDEFDVDENGNFLANQNASELSPKEESHVVDVTTIERIPVFASDSENEDEVFSFEVKVRNLLAGRARGFKSSSIDD